METETAGVAFGLWKPPGWDADTRSGLILAEQVGDSGEEHPDPVIRGAVVNFFCPNLDVFSRPEGTQNVAMAIMEQAISLPHVRSVAVGISDPVPFDWNGHDAAYYLLTAHGGMHTVVIGIYLPERDQLLAMNISMPEQETDRVRAMLPDMFADFVVDGVELGGEALNSLAEPLVFPTGPDDPA
ncbi:MAG: hypothetical protein U0452_10645 [Anaerolineae bacterium]